MVTALMNPNSFVGYAHTIVAKPPSDDSYVVVSLEDPNPAAIGSSSMMSLEPPLPASLPLPIHLIIRPALDTANVSPVPSSQKHEEQRQHHTGPLLAEDNPPMAGATIRASLQVLRVLAASQPLPFVRSVAEMALGLLEVAEGAQRMREACQDIKEIVLAIIVTLLRTTVSQSQLDPRLQSALESFKLDLREITDGLRRIQHKSFFTLTFYREEYKEMIRGYKQRLLFSIAIFQIDNGINMQLKLSEHHEKIMARLSHLQNEVKQQGVHSAISRQNSLSVEVSELCERLPYQCDIHPTSEFRDDNDARTLQGVVRAWAANVVRTFSDAQTKQHVHPRKRRKLIRRAPPPSFSSESRGETSLSSTYPSGSATLEPGHLTADQDQTLSELRQSEHNELAKVQPSTSRVQERTAPDTPQAHAAPVEPVVKTMLIKRKQSLQQKNSPCRLSIDLDAGDRRPNVPDFGTTKADHFVHPPVVPSVPVARVTNKTLSVRRRAPGPGIRGLRDKPLERTGRSGEVGVTLQQNWRQGREFISPKHSSHKPLRISPNDDPCHDQIIVRRMPEEAPITVKTRHLHRAAQHSHSRQKPSTKINRWHASAVYAQSEEDGLDSPQKFPDPPVRHRDAQRKKHKETLPLPKLREVERQVHTRAQPVVAERPEKNHYPVMESELCDEPQIDITREFQAAELVDLLLTGLKAKNLEHHGLTTAQDLDRSAMAPPKDRELSEDLKGGISIAASLDETLVDEEERENRRMRSSPKMRFRPIRSSLGEEHFNVY